MNKIGKKIQEIRKMKSLTQKEFAHRIGVTNSYISAIEKGKKIPSEMFIMFVCEKFDIDMEWLLFGEGTLSSMLNSEGKTLDKTNNIMEHLIEEAEYAQKTFLKDLLYEVYGKAKMAYQLGVISFKEFMQMNHLTIYFINTHAREIVSWEYKYKYGIK